MAFGYSVALSATAVQSPRWEAATAAAVMERRYSLYLSTICDGGFGYGRGTPIYWSQHSYDVPEKVVAFRLPLTTDTLLDPKSRSKVGVLIGFVGVVGVDSAIGRSGLVGLVGGMDKVKSLLKPKPNPQQQLRDWQRRLRQESRNIERQIRDVQREEKNVQKAIREAAKRNDMVSAKTLAKEIVRSRRAVNRLYENKAQLNSISMHLGESVATARTVGHLSKSAEVMKLVNNLMKAPEVAATMQEFSKEMTKAGVIEEMVNDAVDTALDSEDIEEEIEEEVDKVLTDIAGETAAQLPEAARKEKMKQPARRTNVAEADPIAEGVDDDEEELEEIRARLAKVRL